MTDVERLLLRQAEWQKSLRALSWPEKIRLAERLRPSVEAFRLVRERWRAADAGHDGRPRHEQPRRLPQP